MLPNTGKATTPATSPSTSATPETRATVLQAAMVYINTLMIQDVLAEPEWTATFGPVDYRGLAPLTSAHVAMHGEFKLDMHSRLILGPTTLSGG